MRRADRKRGFDVNGSKPITPNSNAERGRHHDGQLTGNKPAIERPSGKSAITKTAETTFLRINTTEIDTTEIPTDCDFGDI